MSLTRRLQTLLALLLLLALATNLWLQLQRTRDFLAQQLVTHAQDTATSLALSLSPALASADRVTAERMIDVVFDRGYFQHLRWFDVNGEPVLQRQLAAAPAQVPMWFSTLLPISAPTAEALLSSGWQQHGRLEIESHTGYAQLALWRSFVDLLIGSLVALFALGVLVLYTVQRALLPLHSMADAAHRFVSRRAPMQLPTAVVSELQPLAQALGQMSQQVAAQFANQAAQLQQAQRQLQCDALTQLPNRAALLDLLSAREHSHEPCTLLGIRLHNLGQINAERGHAATDAALRQLAELLQRQPDWQWFRCGGGDWVGVSEADAELPATTAPDWLPLTAPWRASAVQLSPLTPSADAVLAELDAALAEAVSQQMTWWCLSRADRPSRQHWQQQLTDAIAGQQFRFLPAAVEPFSHRCQSATEWLARLPLADGSLLAAGPLFAHARQLGLEASLESALLQALHRQPASGQPWHLNVSAHALTDPARQQLLRTLARQQPTSIELTEAEALREPALLAALQPLRDAGLGFGLDQVALSAGLLAALPNWRPDYLKLGLGLASAGPDSPLLKQLTQLAHALEIAVLVPIAHHDDSRPWQQADVDGVMRAPL